MSTQLEKNIEKLLPLFARCVHNNFGPKKSLVLKKLQRVVKKHRCKHIIKNGKNKGELCCNILCKLHPKTNRKNLPQTSHRDTFTLHIDHLCPVRTPRASDIRPYMVPPTIIRHKNLYKRKADEFEAFPNNVFSFSDNPDPEYLEELREEIKNITPNYSKHRATFIE